VFKTTRVLTVTVLSPRNCGLVFGPVNSRSCLQPKADRGRVGGKADARRAHRAELVICTQEGGGSCINSALVPACVSAGGGGVKSTYVNSAAVQ